MKPRVRITSGATAIAAFLLAGCGGQGTEAPAAAVAADDVPTRRALAAATAAAPSRYDPTILLDWAERTYPQWFPGPEADRSGWGYVYRTYPSTGNAAGVSGDTVAVLGPISGGSLLQVGTLADFECSVLPHRCSGPTLAVRQAAAAGAAQNHADCVAIQPFHWSVGDAGGRIAEASVGADAPQADTEMAIASASKWLYGAYVAQRRQGALTAEDVPLLNFTSGYTGFDICLPSQTVAECQSHQGALIRNGGFDAGEVGYYYYSGGHMQKHATLMGLGGDDNAALARHIGEALGITIAYSQPQLAGGVVASATTYGRFLQRVAAGRLHIRSLLGSHAVCTNPATCASAHASPIAGALSWSYSVGHWVETDPVSGDGAFSSAGAFGFYPWLDVSKTWWGIVARRAEASNDNDMRAGRASAMCGARIRAAWISGRAP